ncbi:MAG: LOG family protein [Acidobacteria bacterium]|nr:LOG family protein [Acidobacteriota bacterium]
MSKDQSKRPLPLKAYKNLDFLNSNSARVLRILSEYLEPESRFRHYKVKDTIVFFGSARIRPSEEVEKELKNDGLEDGYRDKLDRALEMGRYYDDAVELARLLTEWSKSLKERQRRFLICSGGGPGIMEAANRGAALAHGKSIGLNISLPFEQAPNPFISNELSFEFHYFFMRKFWFIYLSKALVIFPGGFGTLDELLEVLTLIQTKKLRRPIPIVIYGEQYWREVLNFDALEKWGMINQEDLNLFRFADTPQTAFEYLRDQLQMFYGEEAEASPFNE